MKLNATEEQQIICASQAQIMKVKAGAGTGKTTTLRGLAARNRNERILYLAFNKAVKEEAQGRFTPNVKAMTAHGLAFAQVGRHYANVGNKLAGGNLKPFQILPFLGPSIQAIPKGSHNLYGGRVIESLNAFLTSGDEGLTQDHIIIGASPTERKHFNAEMLLADVTRVWENMQDLNSPLPITHDGYLKIFQLTQPVLPYDMILLDEAQDTNPVTQVMVGTQKGRQVYVGDEHQAIYGFRGARNAMALIEADETFELTGSFRFGPAIAEVANSILAVKEETMQLTGLGGPSFVQAVNPSSHHAFIARGNAALFGRAVKALDQRETFAFVGVLGHYRLDLIEQTYRFSQGESVRDPFLSSFSDYKELENYAETMNDREVLGRCGLVNRYTRRIPDLVRRIEAEAKSYHSSDPNPAKVVLTSAHRSKGLEFDQVLLADDYMDFFEDSGFIKTFNVDNPFEMEDINVQYVAATRAKQTLEVSSKLQALLDYQAMKKKKSLGP